MKKVLFLIGKGKAGDKIIEKFSDYDIHIFGKQNLNLENPETTKLQILNYIITYNIYPDIVIFNSKGSVKNTINVENIDTKNLQESLNIGAISLISIIQALQDCCKKFGSKKCLILVAGGNYAYNPELTQFNLSLTKVLLLNIVNMLNQFNPSLFEIKILDINGKIGGQKGDISAEFVAGGFARLI